MKYLLPGPQLKTSSLQVLQFWEFTRTVPERWNLRGFSQNWKVILVKPEFCFTFSFTHVIQINATILIVWKHKQEIFIAIQRRSKGRGKGGTLQPQPCNDKKYSATNNSTKSQRAVVIRILTTLIMARKRQPLTQSTSVVASPSPRKRLYGA